MHNDSDDSFWLQMRKVLRSPAMIVFLMGATPPAVAYVFLAGHFVTQPGSTVEHWPVPFPAGIYVLAIVAGFVTLLMAGVFMIPGFPLAAIAPEKSHDGAFERWRTVLFSALGGGTIGFFLIAFATHRFAHHSIPLGSFLIVPVGAVVASLIVAAQQYGFGKAVRKLAFRTIHSATNWLMTVVYILAFTQGIAMRHDWNWNTSLLAWEYLLLFLALAATTSFLAAHRKYAIAWMNAAFAVVWVAILDPTDVFAMPFRYLHW